MSVLKDHTTEDKSYSADEIEILEGLEPVRKRPGMYIGGTDNKAMHHLIAEIFDNSMDEAVAGHADIIKVTLDFANRITIEDNGRGIPIDKHPKFPDKSALEIVLTTLHSGGKFSNKSYTTSGGLHGVGLSVVNALSKSLEVTVTQKRKRFHQEYSRGFKQSESLEDMKYLVHGTKISFVPDEE
ncbi:MAG: ATP-binding protein, partial [Candidatus Jidaibacter sp.]|nr:ATP-binding protein [Candidatus Jidaibacter sp.]